MNTNQKQLCQLITEYDRLKNKKKSAANQRNNQKWQNAHREMKSHTEKINTLLNSKD